jgi:TonB family protein
MKSCPTCHRQYEDETIRFCLEDGSSLVEQMAPTRPGSGADATLHMPSPTEQAAKGRSTAPPSTITSMGFQPAVEPRAQLPTEHEGRRNRALLWMILALIIGGSGIAIALIITRGRSSETASTSPTPTPIPRATQTIGASESTSPAPAKSATVDQTARVNRPTEKPTLQPRATPASRPTPEAVAASPETPRRPSTVSGGVLNGKATYLAKPAYPAIAKSANVSGAVQVQVLVDENGNVVSAHAISGHPLLQSSAVSAARSSKFTPTKLSGQPVKVSGVIVYNFQGQ